MTFNLLLFIVLIVSALEIFTSVISKSLNKIIKRKKSDSKESKIDTIFKLIFVILFLGTIIYFLYKGIYYLGNWFGIPMNESILDVIGDLVK